MCSLGERPPDVPPEKCRRALEHPLAQVVERNVAEVADRPEQPGPKTERVGVFRGRAAVVLEADAPDQRLGPRVLHEVVEVDLHRLGARALLQQNVATLNEAQPEPFRRRRRAGRATRVQGAACRKKRAGQVLWLVPEVRDQVPHDDFRSIRTLR